MAAQLVRNWHNLKHNYHYLKTLVPQGRFFCPIIKADAYGCGAQHAAQVLTQAGCTHIGVAHVTEAKQLRTKAKILVLSPLRKAALKECLACNFIPAIKNFDELESLQHLGMQNTPTSARPTAMHIELETGLNRTGFRLKELKALSQKLQHAPLSQQLRVEGVFTHFSCGEDILQPAGRSWRQIALFRRGLDFLRQNLPPCHALQPHIFNSASLLLASRSSRSMPQSTALSSWGARPGLALYGVAPKGVKLEQGLIKPVMQLKAPLLQLQYVEKNQELSYGARWRAKQKSLIGFVGAGYADGVPCGIKSLRFRGVKALVCGEVCMDCTLVDLSHFTPAPHVGEDIGILYDVAQTANALQKNPRELLLGMGQSASTRVTRVDIGHSQHMRDPLP